MSRPQLCSRCEICCILWIEHEDVPSSNVSYMNNMVHETIRNHIDRTNDWYDLSGFCYLMFRVHRSYHFDLSDYLCHLHRHYCMRDMPGGELIEWIILIIPSIAAVKINLTFHCGRGTLMIET